MNNSLALMNLFLSRVGRKSLLFVALTSSCLSVSAQMLQLDMGGAALQMNPESLQEELATGEMVAGQLLGATKLLPKPELQKYVNLVGRRVADQSDRPQLNWAFGVVDSSAVNAFAGPGGYILITSAALQLLETEDELAAVLAHEVAHVIRKHHYRVVRKQKMLEFGAAAVKIEDASGMSEKMSQMVAQILARGLDQKSEFEADRDGMVYAARAGYDASALIRVLEKLSAMSKNDKAAELLLSTHPSSDARRIALARQVNQEIEKMAVLSQSADRYRQYVR
jgi:predicted Zn-dependent protease